MFNISSIQRFLVVSILLILLIFIDQSYGQFLVVSTSPPHGSTNVDTSANITMIFNAPLDTTARFPNPEGFFINLYFYPDSLIGEPDSITVSLDLTTVTVYGLPLIDNTTYLFVIVNAVNQSGDSLDIPYSFIFTTGGSLPTATVSGSISYPGNDPTGAVVSLMDENPFGDNETNAVNGAVIPSAVGAYTVDYVEAGIYWPIAIKNFVIDEYGELELKPGSAVGIYDPNGDGSPDSIEVTSGATISNVDMTLFEAFPQTARDPFPNIQTLAQAWSGDAYPVRIGGGTIDADGSSLFWQYAFYSSSLMQYKGWMVIGDLIAVMKPDSIESTTALPVNWLNSDTIMTVAEASGGTQFRQEHSDADVSAFVGQLSFGDNKNGYLALNSNSGLKGHLFSRIMENFSTKDNTHISSLTFDQSIELPMVWGVQYYSDMDSVSLMMIIDVVSGELLSGPTAASAAEQQAFPLAQSWASDAKLWSVGNHAGAGSFVDSSGKALSWACFYYSPSLDSLHLIISWGQLPLFEGPGGGTPDTTTIPPGWLDSDVCIAVAEVGGGAAYRNNNQNVLVYASLSRWHSGPSPELTIWEFRYTSSNAPSLRINVDAFSGNIITGIDQPDPFNFPDRFILYQNYPNPFNPITNISFNLPSTEEVKIEIFNIRGQKIYTLKEGQLNAGFHEVLFDASKLASGIYIYRLTTPTHAAMKKMLLLK